MRHPLEAAIRTHTRRVFVAALVATMVLLGVLSVIDAPLKTPEAPLGIISFELAWDAATARAIVASWSPRARERAVQSLRVDFLFIPAYATAIALGVLWAASAVVKFALVAAGLLYAGVGGTAWLARR